MRRRSTTTGPTSRSGDTGTRTGNVVTIPIGPQNQFTPGDQDRGQPTSSHAGRLVGVFQTAFEANSGSTRLASRRGRPRQHRRAPTAVRRRSSCARSSSRPTDPGVFDLKLNSTVVATGGNGTTTDRCSSADRRGDGERDRRGRDRASRTTTRASSARGTGRSRCPCTGRRSTARSRTATWSSARSRTTGRARHEPEPNAANPPTPIPAHAADSAHASACPSHSASPSGPGAAPDAPPAARPPGREDRVSRRRSRSVSGSRGR